MKKLFLLFLLIGFTSNANAEKFSANDFSKLSQYMKYVENFSGFNYTLDERKCYFKQYTNASDDLIKIIEFYNEGMEFALELMELEPMYDIIHKHEEKIEKVFLKISKMNDAELEIFFDPLHNHFKECIIF